MEEDAGVEDATDVKSVGEELVTGNSVSRELIKEPSAREHRPLLHVF